MRVVYLSTNSSLVFIPARATPADSPPLTFEFASPVGQLAESLCTQVILDESKQNPITKFECNDTGSASASTMNISALSARTMHKANDDVNDLPTLEQLQTSYDPTVQHLDSFMMRHFFFPALEELILKNCKEQEGWISNYGFVNGESFVVRLVRHLTRFRESDDPDSRTCLRRVDLRGTNLLEGSSAVRLMRLLAPHVQFIADPEPSIERHTEPWHWHKFDRDGSDYSANQDFDEDDDNDWDWNKRTREGWDSL